MTRRFGPADGGTKPQTVYFQFFTVNSTPACCMTILVLNIIEYGS